MVKSKESRTAIDLLPMVTPAAETLTYERIQYYER